ncbi:GIY-YIG nuclease family protein [Coraliomargarita parva]|uniref:GIY-YIG nuclease family protein n=1 Tax=Coraliomargarita parva TaxID=3014050 RepID=UPI0022B464CF|nr:GIY-YIG nuclease family protein [Coraliomargarita parva]
MLRSASYAWLRHVEIAASEHALHSPLGATHGRFESCLSMHYVYILRSETDRSQYYVGYTVDLQARMSVHNSGGSHHTSKYMPWELCYYCAFPDEGKAKAFELYLKSHSGKAFASKRLLPD